MKLQVLLILLVFGASALQWLYKTLKEQAEKNRRVSEQRRAEEEALRTGRSEAEAGPRSVSGPAMRPTPLDPEEARLADLAQRRQELVAELRRRAAAKQGGQSSAPRPTRRPPPQPARLPQAPVASEQTARQQPMIRSGSPTTRPSAFARPTQAPPAPRPQRTYRPKPRPPVPLPMSVEPERVARVEAAEAALVTPRGAARATPLVRAGMTPTELRRAIVLQEILGPPACAR